VCLIFLSPSNQFLRSPFPFLAGLFWLVAAGSSLSFGSLGWSVSKQRCRAGSTTSVTPPIWFLRPLFAKGGRGAIRPLFFFFPGCPWVCFFTCVLSAGPSRAGFFQPYHRVRWWILLCSLHAHFPDGSFFFLGVWGSGLWVLIIRPLLFSFIALSVGR